MKSGHPQICLFQPEIPQNTGNIGRLVAATACRLHLVKPFGFSLEERNVRRAGLDYWPFLDLEIHDSIEPLLTKFNGRFAFLSKFAKRSYREVPHSTELFIFGRETNGLPEDIHQKYAEHFFSIPMFHEGVRSLNLANAVAIVTYDQLAKRGLL